MTNFSKFMDNSFNYKINTKNDFEYNLTGHLAKILVEKVDFQMLEKLTPKKKAEVIFYNLKRLAEEKKVVISDKKLFDIAKEIYLEAFEYGPITGLMEDKTITEIMINDFNKIYIERDGVVSKSEICFKDRQHLRNLVEKIISPLGLRVDESYPMVDARLSNGARINVVIKPVSTTDTVVTIRKFKEDLLKAEDLLKLGSLDRSILNFLKCCVENKVNIIVSGGTSSGKTTFLNVLSSFIPKKERIVVIEETPELNLHIENLVNLVAKNPNIEGKGEIKIKNLVKNALRMRPDRVIVGEIRGDEAIDVLQAMNTGHEGSMTTIHANSPVDLISRLETILLISLLNLNTSAVRRIILSSINLIIQLERTADGKRKISKVSEVLGLENSNIKKSSNFEYKNNYLELELNKDCLDNAIIIRDIFIKHNEKFLYTGYEPKFFKRIGQRVRDFVNTNL